MRKLLFLLVLCVLPGAVWGAKPCTTMAYKICKRLGPKAFTCTVYRRLSELADADQQRCKRLMASQWAARLGSLVRSEKVLNQMTLLGRKSGPQGRLKVLRYKQLWGACEIAKMRKGAAPTPAPCQKLAVMMGKGPRKQLDPRACHNLTRLVCRDIGGRSFYCALFSRISQTASAKPKKCQIIIDLWAKNQRVSYLKREMALRKMALLAQKNAAYRTQLQQIKQREAFRILQFVSN